MKIISITMVKNEVDIIESFIRYHLKIFDEMIILDNGSTDETVNIINKLIYEGLPLILIHDKDDIYNQYIKMSELLKKAVFEFNADIVCVLDADEFITNDKCNPREILEKLDSSFYYWVKWITYVPTSNDNESKFIPKRIKYIRDEHLERFYKVIVPKEIVLNYYVELTMGNHDLNIKNADKRKLLKKLPTLKIAHYPLRSRDQCMSKVLVGWPNMISINLDDKPWGWHWQIIFDKIKKDNCISDYDLENFAKYYAIKDYENEIDLYYHPLNINFCEDINIKYDFNYNYLNNILDKYVSFANEIKSLKKELYLSKD